MVVFSGTTFCGNSPVDPSLLSLVHNEVAQLSLNLDDLLCQYKEQKDQLESQFLEVKQSLDQLLELPQEFEQMKLDVETLNKSFEQIKQKVAELSSNSEKSEERVKRPTFFGTLDRNEYFTGRVKELETLEKVFTDTNSSPDVRGGARRKGNVLGICGLGGCGKSSLAFEYAWRNLERYPGGVFVLNGESDDLMRAFLQRIHGEFVSTAQSSQRQEAKPFEQLLNETLSWLGNLRDKWLLLVDNLDQKELSPCARTVFLGQWKSKMSGDILVTSRRRSQALSEDLNLLPENCLELDPFTVDESVDFLKKRTGIPTSCDAQDHGEKKLAEELGGLPLALEQAAAYIKALDCSVWLYLQQYCSQKLTLLNARSAKPSTEVYSEERLAVQTTWLLNFKYVVDGGKEQRLGKAAAFFMKIAAFLSPDEIPLDILNVGAPEVDNEGFKKRLEMPIGAKQIVDLLVRFSLFKRKSGDTLSIHRLVQETLKDRCDCEGETDEVLSSAIRMMHQAFLNCVGGTDFLREVLDRLKSPRGKEQDAMRPGSFAFLVCQEATLEARYWKRLSVNAFHLVCNLTKNTSLIMKPRFFCEESARLFCEAALYCYSVGMKSQAYRLQQLVFEILCAIKEPIRYYKDNDLMKVTRILIPVLESDFISRKLAESTVTREKVNDGTGLPLVESTIARGKISDAGTDLPVDTDQTDAGMLEAIKVIAPKAREAFSRGNFQESAEWYTDIIEISNFNIIWGLKKLNPDQPQLVPLGEIFCLRGIAHLKMGNFETAVDDFNTCTCVDIQHYRGYYWKAYALCKLVVGGRNEFISKAQAATAVLRFKFAHSKSDDIQKLQNKFSGLLDQIEYKFVTQVSELKELEQLSGVRNDSSNSSLTVILADGRYDLKKMTLLGGQYYFVCPPGSSASINCINGLKLSHGSFLFENIEFVNHDALPSADPNSMDLGETCSAMGRDKGQVKLNDTENFEALTLGRPSRTETVLTGTTERNIYALIEADDVRSLDIDHCVITGASYSGIVVQSAESPHERRNFSVRSSVISCCSGTGLHLQGDAFYHISIQDNMIEANLLYGIVIDSPFPFYLKKNVISGNGVSGVVAIGPSGGVLVGNEVTCNEGHGILFNKTNVFMEGNVVSGNLAWGVVCCCESDLHCEENVFTNNFCGGLRIMFNGKGNVLVERCEFRENSGPVVFPTAADERCQTDLELKRLVAVPRKVPNTMYIVSFLEFTSQDSETVGKFNSPELLDNGVSDVDVLLHIEASFCSTCYKDLQMDTVVTECPNCRVARYCSKQCLDKAKTVHDPVCKSILEANKDCISCVTFEKLEKLRNVPRPAQEDDHNRGGLSLCAVIAVKVLVPAELQSDLVSVRHTSTPHRICLLACPQQNVWTSFESSIFLFILRYGTNLPDYMMDVKAACILANVGSDSRTVTLYNHRIIPLEKVPGAFSWVERTLHLFKEHVTAPDVPSNDGNVRLKKRKSRKRFR